MRAWWPYLASEWRTAFGVVCAVFWISESLIAQVMRAGNRDRTDDRGSSLWFVLALPISWLIALVSAGLPWGGFGSTPVFAVGLTLMVAGQLLRWWSVATLGRLFTINVAIRPGHQLIESGPYRHVRHPAYTVGGRPAARKPLLRAAWTDPCSDSYMKKCSEVIFPSFTS
jgi:protein-S-isoprenylcysteine O-methyltransferase Ste14